MSFVRAGTVAALAVLFAACDTSRSVAETGTTSSQCTQCHGYPPPPYVTTASTHPQGVTDCNACHFAARSNDCVSTQPLQLGSL